MRPWLLAIVANEARNRRRAEGRREGLALRAAHELPSGDAAPSPEGRVVAAEARAELLAGLERLRDDDRLVLACRYLLELSEEETARVLSVRRGTVKSRTSRALERLRGSWRRSRHDRARAPPPELREEIAWPETPAIEPDLRPAPTGHRWHRRRLVVALAVLLLVLAGVLAFSSGARSAFLEIFHIRGATVERVERLPEVPTTGIPLGQRVSREAAERRVGFRLVDVGEPDAVYVNGSTVSLVYGPAATRDSC